jgi:F0F1-type ATP synthase membrane subunit c/vacuolar-type H+-ATPase subunit K
VFNFLIIYIMEGLNFVGAGLIVRAALGIGIGGSAMDAIARQPEASGKSNSYAYRSCIN